ncbi:hypothetical protein HUT18_14300 [Streptomyces sp. NA04227]|nr:hypothetical protein [Streptomyces sp. NA04227]QKW10880.1 hypothetical protein HUT18_14300 [Streptomyces sp. NA04227]
MSLLSYAPGLIFITLCYVALCAVSPFGTCLKCKGWGSKIRVGRYTGHVRRGRICRRCQGYGQRIRFGRRLYNLACELRRDGTR